MNELELVQNLQEIPYPSDENGNFYFSSQFLKLMIDENNKYRNILRRLFLENKFLKHNNNIETFKEIDENSENYSELELAKYIMYTMSISGCIGELKHLLLPNTMYSLIKAQNLIPDNFQELDGTPYKKSWFKGNIENAAHRFFKIHAGSNNSRQIGSFESDAIANHYHTFSTYTSFVNVNSTHANSSALGSGYKNMNTSNNLNAQGETRPRNILVLVFKKIKMYPSSEYLNRILIKEDSK